MLDVIQDTLLDGLKLLPFLFLAYLAIELIEHHAGEKTEEVLRRSGRLGPVLGGVIGVVPQCGFSAAAANFYAGGVITRGTLLAVFLSTSDEMLPILIGESAPAGLIFKLLAVKAVCGILVGTVVDLLLRREPKLCIEELCEEAGCKCEESVWKSALRHTIKIFGFLLLVTFCLNLVIDLWGAEHLAGFILNRPVVGELLAGVIGLIPNCAASVVLTELYLSGGMGIGALLAGLLVGSGVGLLVLFRMHHHWKDNLLTLVILYGSGVVLGSLAGLLPIF